MVYYVGVNLRYLVKITLFLIAALFCLHVSLHLVNFDYLKERVVEATNKNYGLKLLINGDVSVRLLPFPSLTLGNVVLLDAGARMIRSESLTISYSFIYFFTERVTSPGSISFDGAKCNFERLKGVLVKEIKSDLSSEIPDIILNDANILFEGNYVPLHSIVIKKRVTGSGDETSASYSLETNYDIAGSNQNAEIHIKDLTKEGDIGEFLISINGSDINLSVTGSGKDLFGNFKFTGDFRVEIANMQKLSSSESEDAENTKVYLESSLNISNSIMRMDNLKFSTNHADDIRGSLAVDYAEAPAEVILDLKFRALDLDLMFNIKPSMNDLSIASALRVITNTLGIYISPGFLKTFTAFLNIEADSVKLYSGEINNFILNADLVDDDIYVNSIAFNVKDIGEFSMYGATNTDEVRKKFKGSAWLSIKSMERFNKWLGLNLSEDVVQKTKTLLFKSDVSVTQHRMKFTDIKAAFGDLFLVGRWTLMRDGNNKMNATSSIRFNDLDLDQIGISERLDSILFLLYNSDDDKTGAKYFEAIHDGGWLRYFPMNLNSEIIADHCKIKGVSLNDVIMSLEVTPGFLAVHNLKVASDVAKFDSKFTLSLPAFRPHIELYGNFSYLDTKFLKRIVPKSLQDSFLDAERPINLMSAHNFDGNISINIEKLTGSSNKAEKLALNLALDNGIATIKSLNGKIYGGDLDLVGSIVCADIVPQYVIGFALNNINPGELMQDIIGIDNLSGYMSMSGSLSFSGRTQDVLLSRIGGSIKISGRNLLWKGFSMDEIVKIPEINTSFDDVMHRLTYYTEYGSTFFDNVSGKIDVVGGIAGLDDIELDNRRFKGMFVARYDIANKLLNSLAKFSFIPIGDSAPIVLQVTNKGGLPNTEVAFDTQNLVIFLKNKFAKR
ncbi:AsmA family protein [Candidatus Lariskella endosymbiont of Hedychridium roseum]|uniref:AsmA family protein n=1 Tax=Candidatus Lariskella endosymbiont of Hedychridium roseum TaxID=3077949 RepID=UPI0030CC5A40